MKKTFTILALCLLTAKFASAQLIPSFEFGLKGGVNLSKFSTTNANTFNSSNRAGYLGGVWARVGGLGLNVQPELYVTGKNVEVQDNNGVTATAKFTSLDLPVLVGSKFGAMGIGGRFYTGPLVSFTINKDQSLGSAFNNAVHLNYKDQNLAWVAGLGLDLNKLNIDLRYEYGLTKQPYNTNNDQTRVSLYTLSLGYRLFSL